MKKLFKDMSQSEIDSMPKEEFDAVDPFEKKSCRDCASLYSVISLWCINFDAVNARGTSLPGCIKCKFWSPNWHFIDTKYHHRRKDLVLVTDIINNTKTTKKPSIIKKFISWYSDTFTL